MHACTSVHHHHHSRPPLLVFPAGRERVPHLPLAGQAGNRHNGGRPASNFISLRRVMLLG
jgi:hypothetical protein